MTVYEFGTLVGMFIGIFLTMVGGFIYMVHRMNDKIDALRKDISDLKSDHGERLARIEGYLEGYFGHSKRTGTEK